MNSVKIFIAGALVILATNVLAGCASENKATSAVGTQRIAAGQEMKKTVTLLAAATKDQEAVSVRLSIHNPEKKPVTSVQTWLSYNPDVLEGLMIDTADSAFELVAPYANTFDQNTGLVMLGRSSAEPVSDEEIDVATIQFKRLTDGAAMIEAYDYRSDLTGHTSVNMMLDGTPINVLLKPVTPLVTVNK